MDQELMVIAATAASLGFIHTLIGPDHYLPFIVMARARGWSRMKTIWITFFSGLGHILSSILLGLIGIALGIVITKLEWVESIRGDIAAWLLIAFGLAYTIWESSGLYAISLTPILILIFQVKRSIITPLADSRETSIFTNMSTMPYTFILMKPTRKDSAWRRGCCLPSWSSDLANR